jgi:ribosomal protein RSM22 (predicted rRNA methylase)
MAQVTVVYWRDIPAQVIVKAGRKAAKRELSAKFQEAIDMAAMRAKAIGTDAYLTDWRRDVVTECNGDLEAEADKWLSQLYSDYDDARIEALVANKGYAEENSDA